MKFTPTVLHRLSKATNYDYLKHGCYSMTLIRYANEWHTIPQHWVINYPYILRTFSGSYSYVNISISDLSKKYANMFTVEYICSLGIPLTQAIMQISDITIVTDI